MAGSTARGLALAVVLMASQQAFAGATLVSRHSMIHAARSGGVDQQQTADGFSTFANEVGDAEGPSAGLLSMAHQYSMTGILGASGIGLEGAFGEGQVRSRTTTIAGPAQAQSGFDITFTIDGRPFAYTIGGALGSVGNGTVSMQLVSLGETRSAAPLFISQTAANEGGAAGASREIDNSGFLAPGKYQFSVHADSKDVSGTGAESNAYYTFSLALNDTGGVGGSGTPVAVPLPAGVWGGLIMLVLISGKRALRRRAA